MARKSKKNEEIDNDKLSLGVESLEFSFNSMFRIPELLNYIMTSILARGVAWLLCVVLALGFGIMFLIGSVALIKGKSGDSNEKVVVESEFGSEAELTDEDSESEE